MTFAQEIALLFSQIGWVEAICLIFGLVCIIVEIFQPGFGIFGIGGSILVITGIVLKAVNAGEGNPFLQVMVLIGLVTIVILIALGAMVISMRYGFLSKTAFVQKSRAVDVEISKGTEDYSFLIGKRGITTSILRPGGNAKFNGKIYTVISQEGFINEGVEIECEEIEGVKIMVRTPKREEDI